MKIWTRTPKVRYSDKLTCSASSKAVKDIMESDVVIVTHPVSKTQYHLNPKLVVNNLKPEANQDGFDGYAFNYVAIFENLQGGQQYVPPTTN